MQVLGRLRRKLYSPAVPKFVDAHVRQSVGHWTQSARRAPSFSAEGKPEFLNRKGRLDEAEDWDRSDVSRLWCYNLHYFDDLNAEGSENRRGLHRNLIDRWIDENPAAIGTGWEPYPCSLRIINLIKWSLAGNELRPSWEKSLALQAEWLSKNIEWHILGNHLFANAKALVFAGLYFGGTPAHGWLQTGLKIITRELPEQILQDGGQFERSPMYHAIALEDLLDLVNVAETYFGKVPKEIVRDWRTVAGRMLVWEKTMKHPDGEIALFNDCAFHIAPDPTQLEDYAGRLGVLAEQEIEEVRHLSESGYVRAERGDAVLFADVGAIGPDYLPGHAHADTLSFEFSLFDDRWIVDTGCSTYEVCDERLRQRGTAAHNTVIVDGQDSSEVWSSFRVARRARPFDVSTAISDDNILISSAHDGYKRLGKGVIHSRDFRLKAAQLEISDRLDGRFATAEANLLLHPEITAIRTDAEITLERNNRIVQVSVEGGRAKIQRATWHPEFGSSIPTQRINITFFGPKLTTTLSWSLD